MLADRGWQHRDVTDDHPPLRAPLGVRGVRWLDVTTRVVIVLALAVTPVHVLETAGGAAGWLSLALSGAGFVLVGPRPRLALVLVAGAPVLGALLGAQPLPLWTVTCFTAFLLTLRGTSGLLVASVVVVANTAATFFTSWTFVVETNPEVAVAPFAGLAAAGAGSALRSQRQYWTALEARARDALASRQAAVDRSVAEERVRIARDLHDGVGHRIAVVSMHLGAAEVHLPPGADAARADVTAARGAVQQVLRETQQILHVLRVGADDGTVAPTPGHERIPALVEAFVAAGVRVDADLPDLSRSLPPEVSAAAFRIVQEALTNAQRHGTGTVWLRVALADAVRIEVVNVRAARSAATGGGHGLVGMRERAASAGGRLDARADGETFRVRAELPAVPAETEVDA
ncbi:signal transduction histidine kinase [Cellulomonas sp. SLBN-39]|nr:signal transduction histidine kinase [Cellulomonas sp. SLBN-39]